MWASDHPTPGVWERLQSERLYPGPRDVPVTDVHPDTRLAIKGIDRMASNHGHIVLRVSPGGGDYRVTIVDDTSESHGVTKVFGPYGSREEGKEAQRPLTRSLRFPSRIVFPADEAGLSPLHRWVRPRGSSAPALAGLP